MQLLHDLYGLVRSWWQVDRVRISPTEGRLLRLTPPCIICVNDRPVEVLQRSVSRKTSTPIVQYDCLSHGQSAQMLVTSGETRRISKIQWCENGQIHDLTESDVQVYSSR